MVNEKTNIFVAFGVNVGNLGRQHKREPMSNLCEQLNQSLSDKKQPICVTGSFAHTGNLVVVSELDARGTAAALSAADSIKWTVVSVKDLLEYRDEIRTSTPVTDEAGIRFTAGLAIAVSGPLQSIPLVATGRGVFKQLNTLVVAVWKRDKLTSAGILDKTRRGGGWGAISTDLAHQLGGVWTARSLRTVDGVLSIVETSNHQDH